MMVKIIIDKNSILYSSHVYKKMSANKFGDICVDLSDAKSIINICPYETYAHFSTPCLKLRTLFDRMEATNDQMFYNLLLCQVNISMVFCFICDT